MTDHPIMSNSTKFPLSLRGYNIQEVNNFIENELPTAKPLDIFNVEFHSQFRGYNKMAVDSYLDKITQEKGE